MEVPRIGFLRPPERGNLRDEARGLLAVGPAPRPVSRLVVARRLPPARRSAEVYLQRRVAILEKQVKSLRLAAGALAEAAYLGDTLEPSDSEDEMEAESDLDNGDEEITSEGEDA